MINSCATIDKDCVIWYINNMDEDTISFRFVMDATVKSKLEQLAKFYGISQSSVIKSLISIDYADKKDPWQREFPDPHPGMEAIRKKGEALGYKSR